MRRASSGLCVAMRAANPVARTRRISSTNTPSAVCGSRLPVGSSAGRTRGALAIARAVANAPRALLADEPTGNLDPETADHVFNALMQLVRATRVAMLIATHNMELAGRMDRRVSLANGQVVELE